MHQPHITLLFSGLRVTSVQQTVLFCSIPTVLVICSGHLCSGRSGRCAQKIVLHPTHCGPRPRQLQIGADPIVISAVLHALKPVCLDSGCVTDWWYVYSAGIGVLVFGGLRLAVNGDTCAQDHPISWGPHLPLAGGSYKHPACRSSHCRLTIM